jgi:hypothetical protein
MKMILLKGIYLAEWALSNNKVRLAISNFNAYKSQALV